MIKFLKKLFSSLINYLKYVRECFWVFQTSSGPAVCSKYNRMNLIFAGKQLVNLDYCVFYGTLLGLTREGDIIKHDYDVDFLLNLNDKDKIIDIFQHSELQIDLNSKSNTWCPNFLKGIRYINGIKTSVDFFFYEEKPRHDCIAIPVSSVPLHVPGSVVFPTTRQVHFNTELKFPAEPENCCRLLYGKNWKTPLIKGKDYLELVFNHRAVQVKNTLFNKCLVFLWSIAGPVLNKLTKLTKLKF